MFKRRFQRCLCWNQVKYAWITITHVCFIGLTLAGSLGRCLNSRPNGLMFKQLPRDPANINAWKNMCDPYIIYLFQGALFRSDHEDENDVQTISHKCEVLKYEEFRRRKSSHSFDELSNMYYLAGSYQPTIGHIKFEPGVIWFLVSILLKNSIYERKASCDWRKGSTEYIWTAS